jgi:hypothetical protein
MTEDEWAIFFAADGESAVEEFLKLGEHAKPIEDES